jgi:hypothetical protein
MRVIAELCLGKVIFKCKAVLLLILEAVTISGLIKKENLRTAVGEVRFYSVGIRRSFETVGIGILATLLRCFNWP